jgi:hypothetical protein
MRTNKIFLWLLIATGAIASCKNKDISLPNYDYKTIYFASQFPVRTVELGADLEMDNSLDTAHMVSIEATMGGVRANTSDIVIDYSVDTTLCNGLYFTAGGSKVIPMPANYYQLPSSQITIPSGSLLGGLHVKLTDAFFADPLSLVNNYAITLVMSKTKSGDSILQGTASVSNPNRLIAANWTVVPKNYVVYVVKYVNPWHGNYLRRGQDVITGSVNQTVVRHPQYVENDEVDKLTTNSMTMVSLPVVYKNQSGTNVSCTLLLTFASDGTCTITSGTSQVTATGTGKFVKAGEKNSWGNKDRDAIYLNYAVTIPNQNMQASSIDTLVLRDRAISYETISPVVQ